MNSDSTGRIEPSWRVFFLEHARVAPGEHLLVDDAIVFGVPAGRDVRYVRRLISSLV
jgi:hypothetical protein